jgi:serine/threonine protein kinase
VRTHSTDDHITRQSIGLSNNKTLSQTTTNNEFQREVELLQHVGSHGGIVTFIDAFEGGKYFHIVTELCLGGELYDRIVQQMEQKKICYGIENGINDAGSPNTTTNLAASQTLLLQKW